MKYEITAERTLRVAIQFEAENEDDARIKAEDIYEDMILNPSKFYGGDIEHDYALCDEDYKTIVDWT